MTINLPDPRFDAFWKMRQGEVDELLARIDALQRTNADLLAQLASATALSDRLWRDVEALQQERTELMVQCNVANKVNQAQLVLIRKLECKVRWHEDHRPEDALAQWKRMYDTQKVEADLNRNLATASAAVVEAVRKWFAALDTSEDDGEDEASVDAGHAVHLALKALDQAPSESVRMAQHSGSDPT